MKNHAFVQLVKKTSLAYLFTFGLFNSLLAQPTPEKLSIEAKGISLGEKHVLIRWAPMDFETWQWGNEIGYNLYRMSLSRYGQPLTADEISGSIRVLAEEIRPLPEEAWEQMADANDMAGVAASAIHGDSIEATNLANGDFLTIHNTNLERENRYSFSLFAADHNFDVAKAMGLAYKDEEAEVGYEYLYYVEPATANSATIVNKGATIVFVDSVYVLPTISDISASPGDLTALISWQKLDEHYTSYLIEKSEDNGANWHQVNEDPFIFTNSNSSTSEAPKFMDSLEHNNTLNIYRIKGCSPFGIIGPASDTVHVIGIPSPVPAQPAILHIQEEIAGQLKVTWDFPSNFEGSIQGFDIYKAKGVDSVLVKMTSTPLPASKRYYIDTNPSVVNYYVVQATDINDYVLSSNSVLGQPKDETPPTPPATLTGVVSKAGVVTLRWTKSPEQDVKGYRVFISNVQDNEEYSQITTTWINDTVFQYGLNLKTLSKEVFFKVKALDFRDNQSAFSPACTIIRPDIIPPAPPTITKVTAEPRKVHFTWAYSSSDDVVIYEFQRKVNGKPGWTTILSFAPASHILNFTDTTASIKTWWDYRLLAKDGSGNIASSKIIKAKPVDDGVRDSLENFTGQLLSVGQPLVVLQWDYFKDPDLIGFQIYRGIDSSQMRSYKFITVQQAQSGIDFGVTYSQQFGFVDDDLDFTVPKQTIYTMANLGTATGGNPSNGNNVYPINPNQPTLVSHNILHYQVMAKYANGASSPLTHVAVIQL